MTGGNLNPVSGMKILTILAAASIAALAGCGTTSQTTSRSGGGLLGLAGGGTPGGGTAASRISAMNGGLVGGTIGAGLNAGEKRSALEAEYKALEYTASGQKVDWKGDQANHYGEVVAAQPYRVGSQNCRQYSQTVFAGGAGATAKGTACRNPDGSWTPLT